jgi:hypothetical protein
MHIDSLDYFLPPPVPSPQAGFTFDQDVNIISFTDTSTHQEYIKSRLWDFGDGSTSGEQNPLHTYTSSGAFEVCLEVTGQKSDTSVHCETVYSTLDIDELTIVSPLSIKYIPTRTVIVESNAPSNIDCFFRIVDEVGVIKMEKEIHRLVPGSSKLIDVSILVPGFYVVQVISGREIVSGKIIID